MRPRLTLSIGVTGHRANKLAIEPQTAIGPRLNAVFLALEAACADELARDQTRSGARLFSEAAPCLRLVSGLATGSDLIAAESLPSSWQLAALLPFEGDVYAAADFTPEANAGQTGWRERLETVLAKAVKDGSVTTLPQENSKEAGKDNAASYSAAGDFMLRQIDILIAVWDGKKGVGDGGTRWVIDKALARGTPVIWINSTGRDPAWQLDYIEEDGAVVSPRIDLTMIAGPIVDIVAAQLALPKSTGHDHASASAATRLADFLNERPRRWSYSFAYASLLNLMWLRLPDAAGRRHLQGALGDFRRSHSILRPAGEENIGPDRAEISSG